jgi:hypothetical protein
VGTTGAAKTFTVAVEKPKVASTASARCTMAVAVMTDVTVKAPVLLKLLPVTPSEEAIIFVSAVTPTEAWLLAPESARTTGTTDTSDWPVPKGARRPVRSSR